ncbi:MAG: cytochrome b/b6 domain-containing protein [Halioglobus sp.]
MHSTHPIWDIPTRLFHWSIVICFALAWWSAEFERYDVHEVTGKIMIVLLLTRVLWGVVGSAHSRFSDFVVGPASVVNYVRGQASATPGHNPLGGWSVLALLCLLLLQAISGLFNSDDILFSGPLYYAAPQPMQDLMGVIHEWAFNILLGLVSLHILAVMYHQLWLKKQLIQPMLFGSATDREGREAPVRVWKAALIAAGLAALLWWGLEQAPQPQSLW